eukprot:gene14038-15497_t
MASNAMRRVLKRRPVRGIINSRFMSICSGINSIEFSNTWSNDLSANSFSRCQAMCAEKGCCLSSLGRSRTFNQSRNLCMISKSERVCWNCKRKVGKEIFFCKLCKIIQPPLEELSLFEMFRSPETFDIDVKELTESYRKLQAIVHPDKFGNSDEKEQQYSAEQSSLINKAYNTILDPLSRAAYLLELKGIKIEEKNMIQDPEFLMEVMEINEDLAEVNSKEDLDAILTNNNKSIDECITGISSAFGEGDNELAKELVVECGVLRRVESHAPTTDGNSATESALGNIKREFIRWVLGTSR